MRKIYKGLTAEDRAKHIIFKSTLSASTTEQEGDTTHAVMLEDEDKQDQINRLLDDKFFNNNSVGWKYNIIRN